MQLRFCLEDQKLLVSAGPGSLVVLFEPSEQGCASVALESIKKFVGSENLANIENISVLLSQEGTIQ